jgi:hypothetical protein
LNPAGWEEIQKEWEREAKRRAIAEERSWKEIKVNKKLEKERMKKEEQEKKDWIKAKGKK